MYFIHLESRRVEVAGITTHPNERWMKQIARNVTKDEWGFLDNCRYLIHDRDTKFCQSFRWFIKCRMSFLTLREVKQRTYR